jgi:hypothetical protein
MSADMAFEMMVTHCFSSPVEKIERCYKQHVSMIQRLSFVVRLVGVSSCMICLRANVMTRYRGNQSGIFDHI